MCGPELIGSLDRKFSPDFDSFRNVVRILKSVGNIRRSVLTLHYIKLVPYLMSFSTNVGYLHLILFNFIAQHSTPLPVTGPQGQGGTTCTCAPQPP